MFFGARVAPPAPRVALRAATRTGSLRAPLQAGPRPYRLQVRPLAGRVEQRALRRVGMAAEQQQRHRCVALP